MIKDYRESPAEIYDALAEAYDKRPDYVAVYRGFAKVFYKILNFNTQFVNAQFNGPYAKTSYLLKEYGADRDLTLGVNDARVRIKAFCNASDKDIRREELARTAQVDLSALGRFVSLIYRSEIPAKLQQYVLPVKRRKSSTEGRPMAKAECLRMIVSSVDDSYIYGNVDGFDNEVKVSYRHTYQNNAGCDWSYLQTYIEPDTNLHLIRTRIKDDVIIPELIIFEPDYLVNITDVANCFESYGVWAMNNLVTRFAPQECTEPILLGNLAGQLLDDEINRPSSMREYKQTIQQFFRDNALKLATNSLGGDFHAKARQQKHNISMAMSSLPQIIKGYDRDKVVLEPSFFTPMLGLQGRVDLMQQDFKMLIEQKSGKARFPEPEGSAPPRQIDKHYVQMLMYMMIVRYNYSEAYERNGRELHCFLMYSKYFNSLCGLDWAPRLMYQAIKIRNQIVYADGRYAREGYKVLDRLRVDDFRRADVNDKFWNNYVAPRIAGVLDPVHLASELERCYVHRMLRFIANEHRLSKLGTNQRDDHGLASIWLNSLDVKVDAGNIYHGLKLVEPIGDHGEVSEVMLRQTDTGRGGMANFRTGDIVILYPHEPGGTPDATHEMLIRGSIRQINGDVITVALNFAQGSAKIFTAAAGKLWAIEHDFMESSYSAQYRGVHALLTAPRSRRELLMLQHRPEVDVSRSVNNDYGDFSELALRVKQARELFLIIGPPGTGKTSFGMLNTLVEELSEPATNVLVVSYTNRAVDEICGKLVEKGIDFIRLGKAVNADATYHEYFIEDKLTAASTLADVSKQLAATRVIVGTTTAVCGNLDLFKIKSFDLCIIDEASQILEPQILPILTAKHNDSEAIKKIVMIGDQKQLPAVVQQSVEESAVDEPILREIELTDCRCSLFERLLRRYGDDPTVAYMLRRQGRMHPDIARFPNEAFYGGKLDVVPTGHQIKDLPECPDGANEIGRMLQTRRTAFVDVETPHQEIYESDKVNRPEAAKIAEIVAEIYRIKGKSFYAPETVGVIVPYRHQIATIRTELARYGIPELSEITIDTVERYQGSQRDYIIYGTTVQRRYQLQFLTANSYEDDGVVIDRKLNVALTRAKRHLVIVGNAELLSNDPIYKRLIESIR